MSMIGPVQSRYREAVQAVHSVRYPLYATRIGVCVNINVKKLLFYNNV